MPEISIKYVEMPEISIKCHFHLEIIKPESEIKTTNVYFFCIIIYWFIFGGGTSENVHSRKDMIMV